MTGEAFGPYRLESLLGRGGMGEVWRAVDTSHGDRPVALKVLGSWLNGDEGFAHRFRRESAMAARLTGPHIVPIHRYGEIDGRLYIDMPLIDGIDLTALLLRDGPLPPGRAVEIVDQIADALDTAHKAGLVHRDVKPSNVLVAARTSRDFVYLIDFGIARAVDGTRYSLSGAVIGTLAYMAPERFDGDGDHRSDVYALGCVLHEALTGRPPFAATGLPGFMKAHHTAPPPRPSRLRPGVPAGLDDVVARAMAKDPADRFPSAGAVAVAAREALGASPPAGPGAAVTVIAPTRAAPAPGPLRVTPPTPATPPAAQGNRPSTPWTRRAVLGIGGLGAAAAVATIVVPRLVTADPITSADPSPGPTEPPTESVERVLAGHTNSVQAVATAQVDGRPVIVSGSYDRTVRIWDIATGGPVGTPLTGHTSSVLAVATAELGGRAVVVSGSDDGTVRVWDLITGEQVGRPVDSGSGAVGAVAVLTGTTAAVHGSAGGFVSILDLSTGDPVGNPLTQDNLLVRGLATGLLDGRPVVVASFTTVDETADIRGWVGLAGEPLGATFAGHTDFAEAVTITDLDGRPVVVSAGSDATVRTWDLRTGEPLAGPLVGHEGSVNSVATTQLDGRAVVVSGGDDRTVRIWDLATGTPVGRPLEGHSLTVNAVAAAQLDGRAIAVSASLDSTVHTWDLQSGAAIQGSG